MNLPNPPRFVGPQGPGPSTQAEWVQFIRWLVSVFQGLQTNVSDVASVASQVAALWAKPADAEGLDFTDAIERINGQLAALLARPDDTSDSDPTAALDLLAGEFAVLYSRPDNSTDLDPSAALDSLNGQVSVLMAGSSSDDSQNIPPVLIYDPATGTLSPGSGAFIIGSKLTPGGYNGAIIIDTDGRIVGIQQAT